MGSFIARQPNGKYCRFSTVVDTITDLNMTAEDYIRMRVEKAKQEAISDAKDVLKKYIKPFDYVKKKFRPYNCTIEEFEEYLHKMGDENGLGEDRINYLKENY